MENLLTMSIFCASVFFVLTHLVWQTEIRKMEHKTNTIRRRWKRHRRTYNIGVTQSSDIFIDLKKTYWIQKRSARDHLYKIHKTLGFSGGYSTTIHFLLGVSRDLYAFYLVLWRAHTHWLTHTQISHNAHTCVPLFRHVVLCQAKEVHTLPSILGNTVATRCLSNMFSKRIASTNTMSLDVLSSLLDVRVSMYRISHMCTTRWTTMMPAEMRKR